MAVFGGEFGFGGGDVIIDDDGGRAVVVVVCGEVVCVEEMIGVWLTVVETTEVSAVVDTTDVTTTVWVED